MSPFLLHFLFSHRCEDAGHPASMMKHRITTTLASAAALTASTLAAASPAFAETAPLKVAPPSNVQLAASHDSRGHDSRDRDNRGRTALIDCGSGDYNSNTCRIRVGFNVVDARVYKQRSKSDCDRGEDWDLRGDRIWVRDGCRAVFEVSSTPYRDSRHDHRYAGRRDQIWGQDGVRYDNGHAMRIQHVQVRAAIETCERAAERIAWNRGRDGARYVGRPNVDVHRGGVILVTGDMKTWGERGPRYVDTHCAVKQGRVVDFGVRR